MTEERAATGEMFLKGEVRSGNKDLTEVLISHFVKPEKVDDN